MAFGAEVVDDRESVLEAHAWRGHFKARPAREPVVPHNAKLGDADSLGGTSATISQILFQNGNNFIQTL